MTRSPPRIVVYGAGGFGRRLAQAFVAEGWQIAAFVDRRATGSIEGVPVVSLDNSFCALPVAIGVFNPLGDPAEIAADLERAGFREIWSPVTAVRKLNAPFAQYWLTNEPLPEAPAIDWADEKSHRVYRALLAYRRSGDVRDLPPTDGLERQYYPADVPLGLPAKVNFVDGGAYDGDTLRALASHGVRLDTAFAFEPDPANFRKLEAFARTLSGTRVVCMQYGLGRASGEVRFNASAQASASIRADGDATIRVVALDQALAGERVDFLKLDVEGAELDALQGAQEILHRCRPRLAISAYHRPADLWEIAVRLLEPDLGYRVYLRAHAHQGFDTVVYGVPAS